MVAPRGETPTGRRLGQILKPYLDRLASLVARDGTASSETLLKPLNIIVITDGVPTDDVESVIVSAGRTLDRLNAQSWQVGIAFGPAGHPRYGRYGSVECTKCWDVDGGWDFKSCAGCGA